MVSRLGSVLLPSSVLPAPGGACGVVPLGGGRGVVGVLLGLGLGTRDSGLGTRSGWRLGAADAWVTGDGRGLE